MNNAGSKKKGVGDEHWKIIGANINDKDNLRVMSMGAKACMKKTALVSAKEGHQGDNAKVYYMVCVDVGGESASARTQVQLVGHEKDDAVNNTVAVIGPQLVLLADQVVSSTRRRAEITEARRVEFADSKTVDQKVSAEIDEIVKALYKLGDFCTGKERTPSWLKSPFEAAVRLLEGEVFAATFEEIGVGGLGCSENVYAAGRKVLDARNYHVHDTAARHSNPTLGRAAVGRPNLQCFARNGMSAMCQQCVGSWRDRNTLTQFYCAFRYSLMQGKDPQVDLWSISESGAKQPRESKKNTQKGENAAVKEQKVIVNWPGTRRQHKATSAEANKTALKKAMLAIYYGGFFLLPHTKDFPDNFGESKGPPPEFLTRQVYEFAVKQLELEKKAREPEDLIPDNAVPQIGTGTGIGGVGNADTSVGNAGGGSGVGSGSGSGAAVPAESAEAAAPAIQKPSEVVPAEAAEAAAPAIHMPSAAVPAEAAEAAAPAACAAAAGAGGGTGRSVDQSKKFKWWTDCFDDAHLQGIWTDPQKAGCRWIPVNAGKAASGLGVAFDNLVSYQRLLTPIGSDNDEAVAADGNSEGAKITDAGRIFQNIVRLCLAWSNLDSVSVEQGCRGSSTLERSSSTVESSGSAVVDDTGESENCEYIRSHSLSPVDTTKSEEELLISPTKEALNAFRQHFVDNRSVFPLVVVLDDMYVGYEFTTLVDLPKQVFAVFSWHHYGHSIKQQPAVVFAVTLESGKISLAKEPVYFRQGHLATEWWTVVEKDDFGCISDASHDTGMFIKLVGEKGVQKILSSQAMSTEVKKADFFEEIFVGSQKSPFAFWTISTEGFGTPSTAFPLGLAPIGIAVEYAMGVGRHGGPRRLNKIIKESCVRSRWVVACFERTERLWVETAKKSNRAAKKFTMRIHDSVPALYVDLLNMKELSTISGPGPPVAVLHRWIFLIVIQVDFGTLQLKRFQIFVPSWLRDVRFDRESRFIFLVEDQDKYAVLSCVPKFVVGGREPCVSRKAPAAKRAAKRSAVFQGAHLQEFAPTLWATIVRTSSSDYVRFRVDKPPRAWLRTVSGFETVASFCCTLGMLLPFAPPDGDCLIWCVLAVVGVIPCLSFPEGLQGEEKKKLILEYIALHQAVVHRARQILVAVIFALHDKLRSKYGDEYIQDHLFSAGQQDVYILRWREVTARNGSSADPRYPGNYCSDIEIAALCFGLGVDINLLFKKHSQSANLLKDVKVRPFRRVMSKAVYVTVSNKLPMDTRISPQQHGQGSALPELNDLVEFDISAYSESYSLSKGISNTGYFTLLSLDTMTQSGGRELPAETMEEVVSKGMLEASFGQARPSGFAVFEDNHYEPMIPCAVKSTIGNHTFKSLDCISERLKDGNKCNSVLSHLMEVEFRCLLGNKEIKSLSTVYKCVDNDTIAGVCNVYKLWNQKITDDVVYSANNNVLVSGRFSKAKCLESSSNSSFPRRSVRKDRMFEGTFLEIPLDKGECGKQLDSLKDSSDSERLVCNSVVTLHCRKACMQAADKGLYAHNRVFGLMPPQSGRVHHVAAGADSVLLADCHSVLIWFWSWFTRAERLVHILCNCDEGGNGWFDFYKDVCSLFRRLRLVSKRFTVCSFPQYDLWVAACAMIPKVGQDVKAFTKGILVKRSNVEFSGRKGDDGYEMRPRDEPAPELMVFPSLKGGFGVFAAEPLRKNQMATEYAGKVLSHSEAVALRNNKDGETSHIRTVLSHKLCLDGRVQPEFGLTMSYYVHNHQVPVL